MQALVYFRLAAVISNEKILSILLAHCGKELISNKNNELKAIDFAYLSGNRHIMNKIADKELSIKVLDIKGEYNMLSICRGFYIL